jgi:16S rRNA processing protein RimM
MQKKNCFLVGTVFKLHGYKGDVIIYNNEDIPLNFNTINYFLIEQNNSLVPFFITKARHKKKNIILVKFEDVNSEEEALRILKKDAYLPSNLLPKHKKELSEKQLVGFKVLDITLGELGKINYINSQTAQQLIYVSKDGKEFCFPMHKQFIININSEKGIMEVNIPKDLISLN